MTRIASIPPAAAEDSISDALRPGTTLCQGQYTILAYINSGGFGVTYLAHDSLNRKVVIKECFPGAMCCRSSGNVRPRSRAYVEDFDHVLGLFQKEARSLARLQHPNIVGVHQIFEDNATAYMALDFVEGPDLLDVLDVKPDTLPPAEIERMLRLLLGALSYVHANGILHRDISPDNILLGDDGVPVLIDFGAAREDAARATRVLSRIHTVKDGYSPQEFYLAGSSQEPASDLYSLAATFYHLISGAPPPNSNLRMAAVAEGRKDPCVPLTGQALGYDAPFLEAIDTCLNVFAKDRLVSADDWLDIIDDEHRVQTQMKRVHVDAQIEKRISRLVFEASRAIEQDARKEAVTAKPESVEAKPDPKLAEREYWAILNEDPEQLAAEAAAEKARLAAEAADLAAAQAEAEAEAEALAADDAVADIDNEDPQPVKPRFSLWRLLAGGRSDPARP